MDELEATSENILMTTACLGGALNSSNEPDKERFRRFCINNKDRVYLEIQHHHDAEQAAYNQYLYGLHKQYGVPLIAGTDTHALNDKHFAGRAMLQRGNKIAFENESSWDLVFKTYDELCAAYKKQNCLPSEVWLEAIENTNRMADRVEPFSLDVSHKYPNVFENPSKLFRETALKAAYAHPYAMKRHGEDTILKRIDEELAVYDKTGATTYMLLKNYLTTWEREKGIFCGPGRGSVSGSEIAYLLHITEMDAMLFDLNFFRFMNPDRISLADVDTDYGAEDRERVKSFLLDDHLNLPNVRTAEIITFNTIAQKGSIRDIGRALDIPLGEIGKICDAVGDDGVVDAKVSAKYPELFEYVKIVAGTIKSVGSHPCGVLIADRDIESEIGICSTSGSKYPVTCLNMKELDALNWVKWDVLGLDNVALINDTCKMAGIERLTPDNVDLEDMDVWRSIRDDTTCIFQFESGQASNYLRRFMSDETLAKAKARNQNFSMIKWMSFANGLLRPACASYRDDVADGHVYDNGLNELNDFLSLEAGHVCMQETIMKFLVEFCGYSQSESDNVRRGIAKKKGTEKLLPEIESRFIEFASAKYGVSKAKCAEVIKPFIQVIMDASSYAFSWNHSDAYSCIGYICGYLRYYHPVEFVATALNVFAANQEKTASIMEYAQVRNIKILPPRFGYSQATYTVDNESKSIYKGIASIKYMNAQIANELYEMAKNKPKTFMDVLKLVSESSMDSRQLEILIQLDFFREYGNAKELYMINGHFDFYKGGKCKTIKKDKIPPEMVEIIARHATDKNAKGQELKSYTIVDIDGLLEDSETYVRGLEIDDYDLQTKIKQQMDVLGYVDLTTNRPEDRRRLLIADLYPLKSNKDGAIWGYAAFTRSIGTGKSARLTVRAGAYNTEPFKVGDIIYAYEVSKNKSGYWYLDSFQIDI
jgi:DNA polymerase-3 subunit alpha